MTGAGLEFRLKGAEDFVEDKACEKGAERASLSKPFPLEEELPLAMVVEIPAVVGRTVDDIEKREELGEVGVDSLMARVARAGIEHVDDVKGKKEAGLVLRVVDVVGN